MVVNHDDFVGTAPDPLVWSGAPAKRRRLVHAVPNYAVLSGPVCIWISNWVSLPPSTITAEDVGAWPYSVGILAKVSGFSLYLATGLLMELLWVLVGSLMLKCLFCVNFVPVRGGPSIDILRSCRFIGALKRSLCTLPGGLGRFLPCAIGGQSLQVKAHWAGEVWSWPYF